MSNMDKKDRVDAQSIPRKILRDVTKSVVSGMANVKLTGQELKREAEEVCLIGAWHQN